MSRASGILLHLSSLSGPYGIGDMGPGARIFLQDLEAMGQSFWQVLPLGPTGYGDSPYQSLSSFAGNELFLSLEDLLTEGLLQPEDLVGLTNFEAQPADRVDYGAVISHRTEVFARLYRRFESTGSPELCENFLRFRENENSWLADYALFVSLKEKFDGRPWTEWPVDIRTRQPAAMAAHQAELSDQIQQVCLLQFLFFRQWDQLRATAQQHGVALVGDIPIFVAHDSADVWARPDLFHLDEHGQTTVVAGVPPDYFSETGQLWGNPLYDWARHEAEDFRWWAERLKAIFRLVDVVRIDHFRGFEAYWEIPGDAVTAINGRWVKGPGMDFFHAIRRHLGDLPIIAEDLGLITEAVDALRDATGFPGMRIVQFCFGDPEPQPGFRPVDFPVNCFAYTGTHDNETMRAWLQRQPMDGNTLSQEAIDAELRRIREAAGTEEADLHWPVIEMLFHSPARAVLLPLQDLLELGPSARMNQPGTSQGNWQWRVASLPLAPDAVHRLCELTKLSQRLPTRDRSPVLAQD